MQRLSKIINVLVGVGAVISFVAMIADLSVLAAGHEVPGALIALTTLGLGALGAGAVLSFAADEESVPDLQETISRTRQQIS